MPVAAKRRPKREYLAAEVTQMGYQIRYIAVDRLVRITFFGWGGIEERITASQLTAEKYGHLSPLRILVDLRHAKIKMTAKEQRQFGRYLAAHPVLGGATFAALYKGSFYASQLVGGEARARGVKSRAFFVEAEAVRWLSHCARGG